MNTHVTEWLSAYYDGELHGVRRYQVEEHLQSCSSCRIELEEMRKLSNLLLEVPLPESLLSNQHFTAQVMLRLPPDVYHSGWQRVMKIGWQAIPLCAVFAWVFGQAVFLMVSLVPVLKLSATLAHAGDLSEWLLLVSGLQLNTGFHAVVELGIVNLIFTALVAVFLCGWIASWWVFRRSSLEGITLQMV